MQRPKGKKQIGIRHHFSKYNPWDTSLANTSIFKKGSWSSKFGKGPHVHALASCRVTAHITCQSSEPVERKEAFPPSLHLEFLLSWGLFSHYLPLHFKWKVGEVPFIFSEMSFKSLRAARDQCWMIVLKSVFLQERLPAVPSPIEPTVQVVQGRPEN